MTGVQTCALPISTTNSPRSEAQERLGQWQRLRHSLLTLQDYPELARLLVCIVAYQAGVAVAIITSRKSKLVQRRARDLGIEHLYQGVGAKREAMTHLLKKLNLEWDAASYMGDDVIDLPVMTRCALAASVPNAHALVRRHAHYVTRAAGGHGAVREFCECLMQAQEIGRAHV